MGTKAVTKTKPQPNFDLKEPLHYKVIYINDSVEIKYPHKKIDHGDILTLGAAKIEVLHTPGHTPNSISLVVTDTSRSSEPQMILTGDLLFVVHHEVPGNIGLKVESNLTANPGQKIIFIT